MDRHALPLVPHENSLVSLLDIDRSMITADIRISVSLECGDNGAW